MILMSAGHIIPSHDSLRDVILEESVSLTWMISDLLRQSTSVDESPDSIQICEIPSDGPSSDDSSSASANQVILRNTL